MGVRREAPGLPGMWASSRFSDLPKAGTRTASLPFSTHCAVPSPPPSLGPVPSSSTSFSGIALGVITSPSRQSLFSRCGTQKTRLNPSAFRSSLPALLPPRTLLRVPVGAPLPLGHREPREGGEQRGPLRTGPLSELVLSGQVPSGLVPSQHWTCQDWSPLRTGPLRTGPLSALVPSGQVLSRQVLSGRVPSQDWSSQDLSPLRTGPLSGLVPSGLDPSQHWTCQDWSPQD